MIKMFITIVIVAILGVGGYCVYLGLTNEEHNNAGMIALDAGNLAQSVTDTFKDGATTLAVKVTETAKEVKDTVVSKVK